MSRAVSLTSKSHFHEWQQNIADTALVVASAAIVPLYLSMFRANVGGVLVRAADILAIIVTAVTILSIRGVSSWFRRAPFVLMVCLMLYILLQGMMMNLVKPSVKEAVQLALVIVTVTMISVHAERHPQLFLRAFLGFSLASMLYTLAVHFAQGNFVRYKFAGDARYIFGMTSIVLLLAWRNVGWRGWYGPTFILSLPPLVASFERKGAFGVVAIVLLLLFGRLLRASGVRISIASILLATLSLSLLIFFGEFIEDYIHSAVIGNYFVDEQEALYVSNTHRTALVLNGIDIYSKHWLFGAGADTLRTEMRSYFADIRLANGTHNFYLDNLIKYGTLGAGLFFAAIGVGTWQSLRRCSEPGNAALLATYLLFVVAFISDGQAVTVIALLPIAIGPMFGLRSDLRPVN